MDDQRTHVEVEELMVLMRTLIQAHRRNDRALVSESQRVLHSLPGMQLHGYERDALKLARYIARLFPEVP